MITPIYIHQRPLHNLYPTPTNIPQLGQPQPVLAREPSFSMEDAWCTVLGVRVTEKKKWKKNIGKKILGLKV